MTNKQVSEQLAAMAIALRATQQTADLLNEQIAEQAKRHGLNYYGQLFELEEDDNAEDLAAELKAHFDLLEEGGECDLCFEQADKLTDAFHGNLCDKCLTHEKEYFAEVEAEEAAEEVGAE